MKPKPSPMRIPPKAIRSPKPAKIKSLRQSIDNVDTAIVSLLAEQIQVHVPGGLLGACRLRPGRLQA